MVKKKTKKTPKMWVYVGPRKVSSDEKKKIEKAFDPVIAKLREEHVEEKPRHKDFNYIIDIQAKWYRHYFYLYAIYKCPGPHAITDTFESKFSRLEYMGNNRFNLSYMRHTGEWWETETDITLNQCIDSILAGGIYGP